jgi:hypothetical protein
MKEKNLRIILYITGIICLYAFFSIRCFPLMNAILVEKMDKETRDFNKYGDLYYFSCVADFKVPFENHYPKYRLSDRNPEIKDADILTYGDSFFDLSFQQNVPELLSDSLNKKVFSYVTRDYNRANPFCLLNNSGYSKNATGKVIIYETVERNIPEKFKTAFNKYCINDVPAKITWFRQAVYFVFRENSENMYDMLLRLSYPTAKAYSMISTLKFNIFGYISPLTSKYSTKPDPWLFHEREYSNQPGGYYYQYSDQEISTYADHILELKNNLQQKYNLNMIFMPIPTKYTICHKVINTHPYNNLLPRLYMELDKRGVLCIKLYEKFNNAPCDLYHGTDTHWNPKGVNMAMEELLKSINPDSDQQIELLSDELMYKKHKNQLK